MSGVSFRRLVLLGLAALLGVAGTVEADSRLEVESGVSMRRLIRSIHLAEEIEAINRGENPAFVTPKASLRLRDSVQGSTQIQAATKP